MTDPNSGGILPYVIAKFVKQGILEKSKKGYLIKDEGSLRKIATIDNVC